MEIPRAGHKVPQVKNRQIFLFHLHWLQYSDFGLILSSSASRNDNGSGYLSLLFPYFLN